MKTLVICSQYLVVACPLGERSFCPRTQREFIKIMSQHMLKTRRKSRGLIAFASVLNQFKSLASGTKLAHVAYFSNDSVSLRVDTKRNGAERSHGLRGSIRFFILTLDTHMHLLATFKRFRIPLSLLSSIYFCKFTILMLTPMVQASAQMQMTSI